MTKAQLLHVIVRLITYGAPLRHHDYYCGAIRGMESDCHCGLMELKADIAGLKLTPLPKRQTQ